MLLDWPPGQKVISKDLLLQQRGILDLWHFCPLLYYLSQTCWWMLSGIKCVTSRKMIQYGSITEGRKGRKWWKDYSWAFKHCRDIRLTKNEMKAFFFCLFFYLCLFFSFFFSWKSNSLVWFYYRGIKTIYLFLIMPPPKKKPQAI